MSLGIGLGASIAGLLWFHRLSHVGFLSDDLVQLSELADDQAPPVWSWFGSEYYGFYRPLTALAWRLQYLLWGMHPFGYRLANLLLHAACVAGVFALGRRLGFAPKAALLASLIFLLDPGPVSAVLSIAGMTGLLAAVLYLSAVVAHLHAQDNHPPWQEISLVLFSLALLAKETALSLPLTLFALHWLALGRRWPAALRTTAPYWALLLAYLGLRYLLFGHLAPAGLAQRSVNPVNLITNLTLYAATPVLPWGLASLKPLFRGNPVLLGTVTGLGLVAAAGLAWVLWRQRERTGLFLGAWVAITAAPALGMYSPWNAYLPAVGVALLLGRALRPVRVCGEERLPGRTNAWSWPRMCRSGAVCWLILAAVWQVRHAGQWAEASALRDRVLAAVTQAGQEETGPWLLAGVPGEYEDVPVFGGAWGMTAALRLLGVERPPLVLPAVHLDDPRAGVTARVDSTGCIRLAVQQDRDFFRLDPVAVLARDVAPRAGYSYTAGDLSVRVAATNTQGQPSVIEADLVHDGPLPRVRAWDGTRLVAAETSSP